MQSVKIRNNTLGVRTIGEIRLVPGQTEVFTEAQLKPFMGNKAFQGAFKPTREFPYGKLQEIPDQSASLPDALGFRENAPQPGKPEPLIGEVVPVHLRGNQKENQKNLDAFLQSGAPVNAKPEGSDPAPVPELTAPGVS